MTKLAIGPLTLLVPEHATRAVVARAFNGTEQEAEETPAAVISDSGLLLEVVYQRWEPAEPEGQAGQVFAIHRGDGDPVFDHLIGRSRIGVRETTHGTEWLQAEISYQKAPGARWGSRTTGLYELDELLDDSAEALLIQAGALDVGTREELLNETNRNRNQLAALFESHEPFGPLALYTLTRVLPIHRAVVDQ